MKVTLREYKLRFLVETWLIFVLNVQDLFLWPSKLCG